MARNALVALVATLILGSFVLPATAVGQQAVAIRIDSIDVAGFPSVRATVTVTDATGRPITGLGPETFTASANGQRLPISSVGVASDQGLGIAVVIALDTSGSMQGTPLAQAKDASKLLLNELGANDQAAVINFANSVQVVQPFTADRGVLNAAIDSLSAGGNTALYQAVAISVSTAQSSPLPRKAIVLLTDGVDFGGVSNVDRSGSLVTAQTAGIPMYLVGLGQDVDQPYLQDLVNATRGQISLAPTPDALQQLYQSIGASLRQEYLLQIDASKLDRSLANPVLHVEVNQAGATAAADAPLNLPALPATTTSTAGATPTVTPESGGSSLLIPLLAVALVGMGGLVGGVVIWRRRRRNREAEQDFAVPTGLAKQRPVFLPTGPIDEPRSGDAWIEVTVPAGGPHHPLGEEPVTIGFTDDCDVVLPSDGPSMARARVWHREGRYMLHNLSHATSVRIDGRPVMAQVVLEDGDLIEIGACRLQFRSGNAPAHG